MPAVTADYDSDYVMVEVLSVDENIVSAIIYPNPASEKLNIFAEGMTNVSVFNVVGQRIMNIDVDADNFSLDVSSLMNGIYMLKVSSVKGDFTRRISVNK